MSARTSSWIYAVVAAIYVALAAWNFSAGSIGYGIFFSVVAVMWIVSSLIQRSTARIRDETERLRASR